MKKLSQTLYHVSYLLTWKLPSSQLGKQKGSQNGTVRHSVQFSSVQSLSRVRLFATPWIAARQASLSITNSRSLFKLMPIKSVMPSRHLDMLNSNAPKDFCRLNYKKWRKIQMNNWVTSALVSKLCFTLFLSLNQLNTDHNPSNIEYNACVNIQVF